MSVGDILYNVQVREGKHGHIVFVDGKQRNRLNCSWQTVKRIQDKIKANSDNGGTTTVDRVLQTNSSGCDRYRTFHVIDPDANEEYYLELLRDFFFMDEKEKKTSGFIPAKGRKMQHWVPKWRQIMNEGRPPKSGGSILFDDPADRARLCLAKHKKWWLPVFTSTNNLTLPDSASTGFFPENLAYAVPGDPTFFLEVEPLPEEIPCRIVNEENQSEDVTLVVHGFLNPEQLHSHIRKHMAARADGWGDRERAYWVKWLQQKDDFFPELDEALQDCPWDDDKLECDFSNCATDRFARVHTALSRFAQQYLRQAVKVLRNSSLREIRWQKKGFHWSGNGKKGVVTKYRVSCMLDTCIAGNQNKPVLCLKGWCYGRINGQRVIHLVIHSLFFKENIYNNNHGVWWPFKWKGEFEQFTYARGELQCR